MAGAGSRPLREVVAFVAATFAITWGVAVAAIGFPDWFKAQFGELYQGAPMFYLAVWAPNIAAVALTAAFTGLKGLKALFAALFRWRVSPLWWVVAIGFYPALLLIQRLMQETLGWGEPAPLAGLAALSLPLLLTHLSYGPVGEELGWRGFLLPRLLERMSPLAAGVVIGLIWMTWHVPAFLISGLSQNPQSILWFFIAGTALSVLLTWIWRGARGSILVGGVVPHLVANVCNINFAPFSPQGAAVFAGAVLLLALLGGRGFRQAAPAAA